MLEKKKKNEKFLKKCKLGNKLTYYGFTKNVSEVHSRGNPSIAFTTDDGTWKITAEKANAVYIIMGMTNGRAFPRQAAKYRNSCRIKCFELNLTGN